MVLKNGSNGVQARASLLPLPARGSRFRATGELAPNKSDWAKFWAILMHLMHRSQPSQPARHVCPEPILSLSLSVSLSKPAGRQWASRLGRLHLSVACQKTGRASRSPWLALLAEQQCLKAASVRPWLGQWARPSCRICHDVRQRHIAFAKRSPGPAPTDISPSTPKEKNPCKT